MSSSPFTTTEQELVAALTTTIRAVEVVEAAFADYTGVTGFVARNSVANARVQNLQETLRELDVVFELGGAIDTDEIREVPHLALLASASTEAHVLSRAIRGEIRGLITLSTSAAS